jgi:hypothetical protein
LSLNWQSESSHKPVAGVSCGSRGRRNNIPRTALRLAIARRVASR